MLAKLKKELEILRNKVRFIKDVIEDRIIIKRVKRKVICQKLKEMKYLTMSELNEIQKEQKRVTVVKPEDEGSDVEVEKKEEEMEDEDGDGISPKEYDYLLSMPLWALSEEKVEELNR